ncbi:hypothetical protein H5T88_08390 [bacterium]|nr:hypothetical protein [bacterium]
MKKFGYLLLGIFLATLLVAVPLLSQQAQRGARVPAQPGQGMQQALTSLAKVLDSLNLTSKQKDLALKIAKERADAFVKFATAQAQLGRLARDIRNGQQVSDDEAKRALETYYKEQANYFRTLMNTERSLRTLPPKAQVVILAPGFAGGRAVGGRVGGGFGQLQGPMGKGPKGKGPAGK